MLIGPWETNFHELWITEWLLYCLQLTWRVVSLQVSSTISESGRCIVYNSHDVLFPCRCQAPSRRVAVVLFTTHMTCCFLAGVKHHLRECLLYCLQLTWCVVSLQVSSTISESVCCIVYNSHDVLFPCRCQAPSQRVSVVLFTTHMMCCFPAGVKHHLGEWPLYCLQLTWRVVSLQVFSTMSENGCCIVYDSHDVDVLVQERHKRKSSALAME